MVADGITKLLGRIAFERFKKQLGVIDKGIYKYRDSP